MSDRSMPAGDPESVGAWTEEAAKLLGALSGMAHEHRDDLGESWSAFADTATAAVHDVSEHLATGGDDCTYCPVCRGIAAVRQTSPEVLDHLGAAASSLAKAVAGLLSTPPPPDDDFDLDESEDR